MNTAEFVAKQLALPKPERVIPDLIYMRGIRRNCLDTLLDGYANYNIGMVFIATAYYEDAIYFAPTGSGWDRVYPNGVL